MTGLRSFIGPIPLGPESFPEEEAGATGPTLTGKRSNTKSPSLGGSASTGSLRDSEFS